MRLYMTAQIAYQEGTGAGFTVTANARATFKTLCNFSRISTPRFPTAKNNYFLPVMSFLIRLRLSGVIPR